MCGTPQRRARRSLVSEGRVGQRFRPVAAMAGTPATKSERLRRPQQSRRPKIRSERWFANRPLDDDELEFRRGVGVTQPHVGETLSRRLAMRCYQPAALRCDTFRINLKRRSEEFVDS